MGSCSFRTPNSELRTSSGLTLLELLIAIAITAILVGVTLFMLNTCFESFFFSQQDVVLEKFLDDCLGDVSGEGFGEYGIKDALELVDVGLTSIVFVPLWVDESHQIRPEHRYPDQGTKHPFVLNRLYKPGTFIPLAEVRRKSRDKKKDKWSIVSSVFVIGTHENPEQPDDRVVLTEPVDYRDKIRFLFHPDAGNYPECAMTIALKDGWITKTYKGQSEQIPRHAAKGISISGLTFQYFDNTNTEVEPKKELINDITAIKVNISASLKTKGSKGSEILKTGFSFINLRNTKTAGAGLVIRKGTRIKIPDSRSIRVFSLSNIIGINNGDIIELTARDESGRSWQVTVELGYDGGLPVAKAIRVEHPKGHLVLSEKLGLSSDVPIDLLNLGDDGRFDYDFDKSADNVVVLEGSVSLEVTRMDPQGAALFIRP